MSWLARHKTYILLFIIGLSVYAAVAAGRLRRQSADPHFIYLADSWLNGHIAIDPPPERGDDWAKVERLRLGDGRAVEGRRLKLRGWVVGDPWLRGILDSPGSAKSGRLASRQFFQTVDGEMIALGTEQKQAADPGPDQYKVEKVTHHVSFPPLPAVLMLPQVAIHGRIANDVFPTVLVAALILPLAFATLRRLVDAGLSSRTTGEDLWLVACLAFGTALFYSSVQGRVWFTAHVVGVALALAYSHSSIEARRPILAGICLGLATLTRTPMAFMFPLFAFEAWRVGGGREDVRKVVRLWVRFAVPVLVIAVVAAIYNQVRFSSPLEFGHSYLDVRQQTMIEEHGLFSYHYLSRNLAVALALLPSFEASAPYVQLSEHGLALWATTPVFLLLLWPRVRGPLHRPLLVTVACIAVPILLYQNSGRIQFGYRFSLDYTVFLVLLLAVGGRPLTRLARLLIIVGIAINLFGAVTFARYNQFYDTSHYDTVIRH